jgi:hypothetical protein
VCVREWEREKERERERRESEREVREREKEREAVLKELVQVRGSKHCNLSIIDSSN